MFRELESFFKLILVGVFAGECIACETLLQKCAPLCNRCGVLQHIHHPVCEKCGNPVSQRIENCGYCEEFQFKYLDSARSLFWLTEEATALLHAIKYQRQFGFLKFLRERILFAKIEIEDPETAFIPVPISFFRYMNRGFNQAFEIASWLGEETGLPVSEGLVKVRQTKPQSTLGKKERESNLKDAFKWDGRYFVPLNVVLIDDVFTTGNTLETCAKVLKETGVVNVQALTLFRAQLRQL